MNSKRLGAILKKLGVEKQGKRVDGKMKNLYPIYENAPTNAFPNIPPIFWWVKQIIIIKKYLFQLSVSVFVYNIYMSDPYYSKYLKYKIIQKTSLTNPLFSIIITNLSPSNLYSFNGCLDLIFISDPSK